MPASSSYGDSTFQEINHILDIDVDPSKPSTTFNYLVIDTNTLINNLSHVQSVADEIEIHSHPLTIVVPGIVIQELDSLKQGFRDNAWKSRVASKWILKKLLQTQESRSSIRGQAFTETCLRAGNWKRRGKGADGETNDDLIIDCACYFAKNQSNVWVWSGDVQLCAQAAMQGILVIYDDDRLDSSTIISAVAHGQNIRPGGRVHPGDRMAPVATDQYGTMEVDDEDADMEPLPHVHPLDELHEQVVGHFTDLLRDTVRRAAQLHQERKNKGPESSLNASIHAPKSFTPSSGLVPTPEEISQFKCRECIQYLNEQKPVADPPRFGSTSKEQQKNPTTSDLTRVSNFLTLPYATGARKGKDWTLGDWKASLAVLGLLADWWDDQSLKESLRVCGPVVDSTFLGMDL